LRKASFLTTKEDKNSNQTVDLEQTMKGFSKIKVRGDLLQDWHTFGGSFQLPRDYSD
jgi:hypothetical protein